MDRSNANFRSRTCEPHFWLESQRKRRQTKPIKRPRSPLSHHCHSTKSGLCSVGWRRHDSTAGSNQQPIDPFLFAWTARDPCELSRHGTQIDRSIFIDRDGTVRRRMCGRTLTDCNGSMSRANIEGSSSCGWSGEQFNYTRRHLFRHHAIVSCVKLYNPRNGTQEKSECGCKEMLLQQAAEDHFRGLDYISRSVTFRFDSTAIFTHIWGALMWLFFCSVLISCLSAEVF